MKSLSLLLVIGMLTLVLLITPSRSFAASINCSHIPSPCDGTNDSDAIKASGINGVESTYNINGLGGADTVVVQNVDTTNTVRISGGSGDDKIGASSKIHISAIGDEGDDIISLSSLSGTLLGLGGTGSDKLIAESPSNLVILFQNFISNEPDGKRDILNCKDTLQSTAYISIEDGDTAVHCTTVKTGPFQN